MSISASFAADVNQTNTMQTSNDDTVVSSEETTTLSSSDENVYSAGSDSEKLSATSGSFKDLSTLINSSTTGSITLDKNYTYNSATDSAFVNGITIDNSISIDGAGFTINGNDEARIFNVYGSNVLLRDVNFINGYTTGNTGAVNWYGANGYLFSSTFKNNAAENYGALYWNSVGGTISGVTFTENHATSNYGAAFIDANEVKMINCVFTVNYAVNYGALGVNKDYITVSTSTFSDNYATTNGGSLYWIGAQGILNNCIFDSNHAQNYGSFYWSGSYGVVDDCEFSYNYADVNDGAGYFTGGNSKVLNSRFDNNCAKNGLAGALNFNSDSGIVLNTNFTNNNASTNAGGIYCPRDIGYIQNCYFYNNRAKTAGALQFTTRNPRVLECKFVSNYASENGGAVVIPGAVFDSTFENNVADGNGGAIQTSGSGTTFRGNVFKNNKATNGGAFSVINQKSYIENSTFEGNIAITNGGAIYITVDDVAVANSVFTNNKATNLGGAIYNTGNYFSALKCTFNGNIATKNSGAIYVSSEKSVAFDYTLKTSSDTVNATNKIDMPVVLYASDTGLSTNTGTENSPLDLDTALTKVANGGTVYVKSGTYVPTTQVNTKSKTLSIIGLGDVIFDFNKMTGTGMYITGPACLVANIRFTNEPKNKYTLHGDGCQYTVIENCTFENTGKVHQGGRFWTMLNCTFKNNDLTTPTLSTNYYNQYVTNCTFINNSNTGNGVIQISQVGWIITGTTFINNTSPNGGAIYTSGFILEISDSKFINNTATTKGGAIFTSGQEIIITNCYFSGNNALEGGAIYSNGVKATIADTVFNDNAASDGGAVYTTGREVIISGSDFDGNNVNGSGGAVYSTGIGATVSNSTFENNAATNGSAVMVGENTDITIKGSDFNGNAGNGSVYVPEGSNFVIDSETTFENNEGGDLVTPGVVSAKVLYVNITATGDGLLVTAPTNWELGFANVQDGGILYVLPGTYDMSQFSPMVINKKLSIIGLGDVIFTNYARGKIFDIKSTDVKLENIKFTSFTGDYITWGGSNGVIESCVFDGEGVTSNGKLISTSVGLSNFKISNSNFTNLKYKHIIYANNFLTTVENSIFKSNTPYSSDSYLIDVNGSDFSIVNSVFESNTAKIVNFESTATRSSITGSTFTNNDMGSGNSMIYINSKSSTISGSTFKSSNTGGTFKNVYATEDITLTGNTIEGVTASLNNVTAVTYPNNPTVTGTFNDGINRAYTIPVTANNILLPNVKRSGTAVTFTYSDWDKPLPNTYNFNFATTDANGNKYTYTSTPSSKTATVNRLDTVYISPSGTGTGASSTSQTTWDKVADIMTDDGEIVFEAGIYPDFYDKTISKSWTLTANNGNVILDAGNNGRIFNVTDNNVKINSNFTFKNAKVDNGNGGAIYWSGDSGVITGCNFTGNTAQKGGAIYWSGDSGVITGCNFTGNSAVSDVRNIYIDGNDKVTTNNNVYDVLLTYEISNSEYGSAANVTGTFNAGVNFVLTDVTLNINGSDLKTSLSSTDGSFTIRVDGILGADIYNITATSNENKYIYKPDSTKNFEVTKASVVIENVGNVIVTYGMNNEVSVSGDIVTTRYGVAYTENITVTINGKNGTAKVLNNKFTVKVSGMGGFEVKTYDIKVEGKETPNYKVQEYILTKLLRISLLMLILLILLFMVVRIV